MADPKTIYTLIVVCCHAIWLGDDATIASDNGTVEDGWLIEPFQKDETSTFVKHIAAGIQQLLLDKSAILVFSGGSTKPSRTQVSEAVSYNTYARRYKMLEDNDLLTRTFMEADATDSFQNVLFSLLRFPQFVQHYYQSFHVGQIPLSFASQPLCPRKLIVISHEFKRARFQQLHLPAIRYPATTTRFEFIGIDPPFSGDKMQEIREGDAARGYGAWMNDLYGNGEVLAEKRVSRGWTGMRQVIFAKVTGLWLAEAQSSGMEIDERMREQFTQITRFVGGSGEFPETTPWS